MSGNITRFRLEKAHFLLHALKHCWQRQRIPMSQAAFLHRIAPFMMYEAGGITYGGSRRLFNIGHFFSRAFLWLLPLL